MKDGRREESRKVKSVKFWKTEQTDEVITFSAVLNVWGGEEASLAEPQTISASGARWVGCEPYKEEHTLRSPFTTGREDQHLIPHHTPLPTSSAKLESYHLKVMTVAVGSGTAHLPNPFCLNTLAARLPDSNIRTRTLFYPFYVRPPKIWALYLYGAFISCEMNASLLNRTREPRAKAIWGKPSLRKTEQNKQQKKELQGNRDNVEIGIRKQFSL